MYVCFTVVHISKGQKCFLDVHDVEPSDVPSSPSPGKVLPEASDHFEGAKSDRLIVSPPSEVWGYDADCLILGVVASCHTTVSALYVWYRNGLSYKQGNKLSCIAIREAGVYTVEVQYREERDISEPVYIRPFSDDKNFLPQTQRMGRKAAHPTHLKTSLRFQWWTEKRSHSSLKTK